jgi:superfamily II DNA or RNA helicase
VLRVEHSGQRLVLALELRRGLHKPDGTWTKLSSFTPQLRGVNLGAMAWGRPEDQEIVRLLLGEFGHFYSHVARLTGAFGTRLLHLVLATGRCYWQQPGALPLQLGPQRSGKLAWRDAGRGRQEATVEVEPAAAAVLPLDPPYYVAPEEGVLTSGEWVTGPLETSCAPEVVRAWLGSPVVAPEQVPHINAAVATMGLDLPRLKEIPVVVREDVQPLGVLRLRGRAVEAPTYARRWGEEPPPETLCVAEVFYQYDHLRALGNDPELIIEAFEDGGLVRVTRQLRAEQRLLRQLERAGLNPIDEVSYWAEPAKNAAEFSPGNSEDWMTFVIDALPKLKEKGWIIEEDPSFEFRLAEAEEWFTDVQGSGQDWFDVELGVIVDGQRINLLPLLGGLLAQLGEANSNLEHLSVPLPDGRRLRLPAARLQAIRTTLVELFNGTPLIDGKVRLAKLAAAGLQELDGAGDWVWRGSTEILALSQKLRDFSGIKPVEVPPGLRAVLRGYQQEGLNWLGFLREHGFGGILADDMGLGKTVQALAHLLVEKASGRADRPSLVVAPTSLMANWRQEAARFAPDLRVLIWHGGDRHELAENFANYDLIVTSYALLPRDQEILGKQEYHVLILDEAQYIKNARTTYAKVAGALKARHRLCMTGTPLENHLGELWSLMSFLMPGVLGDSKQFRQLFRDPVEKRRDAARLEALRRRVRPFLVRRRKEDVLKELPPKTHIVRTAELLGTQRDLYETIRLAMQRRVRDALNIKGMARSQIVILDALLKLRQVCCDPRLVKLGAAERVHDSAKLELLMEMLPQMLSEGRRVLLFSQFTSMLELIELRLEALGIEYVKLTGSTTNRETPVRRFQECEVPLFLISLKAGGTGLNLTAADTVIHYDPWWNPAVEDQATDRAHRIGQQKAVFVYKLLTAGTVEEKIVALQEKKRALVEGLLASDGQAGPQLTKEELEDLLAPLQ